MRNPNLFTYVLRHDDGAAPNPFWDVCTLVICKPVIRRTAKIGDWIIGTGSANSPIGDIRDYAVYIMKVSNKISLLEYDIFTKDNLKEKIPDLYSGNPERMVGDSIYDFTYDPPKQRKGVHKPIHQEADLNGKYALLSNHFFYFGDQPIPIPENLQGMIMRNQGHRSTSNLKYLPLFLNWLDKENFKINHQYGKPQGLLFKNRSSAQGCSSGCVSC